MNIRSFLTINEDSIKDIQETLNEIKELSPEKTQNELEKFIPKLIQYGLLILLAIIVYFIGKKIVKMILKIIDKSIKRANIEPSIAGFLMAVIKVVLNGFLFIIIIGMVGIDTTSLAALVGSAGLAIGLAFQGSLSNFAGGVLIILMKPFRTGDYIISDSYEGTVTSIDIFYTRLITADNRMVVIPNGTLSNSNIINATSEPVRRLDLLIRVNYKVDINKVKEVLLNIMKLEERVRKDYDINIFIDDFNDTSISWAIKVWVNTDDYWGLKWDILEKIKIAFDENDIEIPYNKMDIMVTDNRA